MTSQPGKQTIHILLKISRNKANRILHEKHFFFLNTQNVLEKLFPVPFLKNQN